MYSRITGSKDGREAIRYAMGKGPGRNGRNLLVTTINMMPDGHYAEQMEPYWRKARAHHKKQVRRIIISFSKNEMDPSREVDVEMANTIVKEFVRKYYPDRQALLCFQDDGEGGCLHCHAIINDISMSDYKGCSREQQFFLYVRHGIDAIASQYITLDKGKRLESRQSHTERAKTAKAAKIKEQNPDLHGEELRKLLIQEKAYSYIEDMKNCIHNATLASSDEKGFFKRLKETGIEVVKKISAKYGEHYVYNYVKCPVKVKNTKARSYKMGYSYGPEAVRTIWKEKQQTQQMGQPMQQQEPTNGTEAFLNWLHQQDASCFTYGADGRLIGADFAEIDRLHEQYLSDHGLASKVDIAAMNELSRRANSARRRRRKEDTKIRKQAQMATMDIMPNKGNADRQRELTL